MDGERGGTESCGRAQGSGAEARRKGERRKAERRRGGKGQRRADDGSVMSVVSGNEWW